MKKRRNQLFSATSSGYSALKLGTSPEVERNEDLHRASETARYNVTGARRRAPPKVFAMWHKWTTLLLVCCALVRAEEVTVEDPTTTEPAPVATTRAPGRTLDRQAAELAWKTWLQSPESGNQNAPPRRITTKSLFITPLNCPKGQRLDRNGCVQAITINKDEHERNLLTQLNALFTPAPATGGDVYDYGDDEPGPLQLSIPIGLDPLASPLQGQDPSAQAQDLQETFVKFDKKGKPDGDTSIEAELEILKLQNTNYTSPPHGANGVNHNDLTNIHSHPKRDSTAVNVTDSVPLNKTSEDVGQKEVVFGHVSIDPVMSHLNNQDANVDKIVTESQTDPLLTQNTPSSSSTKAENTQSATANKTETTVNATENVNDALDILKKDGDQTKLNPENDYSDIGEAIKLISRYAEVTTDDNFAKDQKKNAAIDDGILGTRTRLQNRRNKPKGSDTIESLEPNEQPDNRGKTPHNVYPTNGVYYRYPWPSQHATAVNPPPDYPFRHLQDYWPGRNKFGGVYNTHENPRRHHHSYPHSLRPHPYVGSPNLRDAYPEQLKSYIHRLTQRHLSPVRAHTNNQDLYTLLGLRHWFSSEGTSKR